MPKLTVANEIYRQIGGRRFAAMTGARQFAGDKDSLRFRIGRNRSKAAIIRISLNGYDLYDMTLYRSNGDIENIREMLYAEDLERVFASETGLDTRL